MINQYEPWKSSLYIALFGTKQMSQPPYSTGHFVPPDTTGWGKLPGAGLKVDVAVFTWRVAPVLGTCEIEIARVDRWGSHTSNNYGLFWFIMVYYALWYL